MAIPTDGLRKKKERKNLYDFFKIDQIQIFIYS